MQVTVSLKGENEELSIEPLLAYHMPLMSWENSSFPLEGGGFTWPAGLGEQSECWILAPAPQACTHTTATVHGAISHGRARCS